MQTIEHISSTKVRHEWKNISAGLAAGKAFVVEKHGRPEAVILPPRQRRRKAAVFDLDAHFRKIREMPVKRLEIRRAPEL